MYKKKLKLRIQRDVSERGTTAALGNIGLSLVLFTFLPADPNAPVLHLLTGLIMVANLARIHLGYLSRQNDSHVQPSWQKLYTLAVLTAAAGWGLLGFETLRLYSLGSEESTLVLLLISGVSGGGPASLALLPGTLIGFLVLILGLPLLSFLITFFPTFQQGYALPFVFVLYFLYLARQGRSQYKDYLNSLKNELEADYQLRRLEEILNSIPGLVTCIDKKLRCVAVNQGVLDMTELRREDLIGQQVGYYSQNPLLLSSVREFMESERQQHNVEVMMTSPSGPRTHALLMKKINSPSIRAILISIDVEDQKRVQKEVLEHKARLAESSKMAALGTMAGGIAHEINNPLAIIVGFVNRIGSSLDGGQVQIPKLKQDLEKIEKTAMRISKIVKGLRQISRDGEGDPFEEVSLSPIIEDTLALCNMRFRIHDIRLTVVSSNPHLAIFCRGVQISQVLLNLLNNSFDAVVNLPGDKWVELKVSEEKEGVELAVTDCGAGIPADVRLRIMQPFFTTKKVGEGTGIGLSISKGIIEAHGGRFEIDETCPNTRFVIYLPRLKELKSS